MIEDNRLEKKQKFIEFLGRNPFYRHACWFVGISEQTLSRWKTEDEDFKLQCEAMRAQNLSKYVNRSSPEFVLTHADPESFLKAPDQKLEITVHKELTDEQLDQLIAAKARKIGATGVVEGKGTENVPGPAEIRETTPEAN